MLGKTKKTGQSLGEYALAAALVAIVGIGACTFVATQVGNALPDLTARIFNGGGGPMQIAKVPPHSKVATSGRTIAIKDNKITFTTEDGHSYTFSNTSTPAELVETAGGNGSTKFYLAQLEQIIGDLEAEGAPAEQLNPLKALLESGNRIANIQTVVEGNWVNFTLKGDEDYWYEGVYTDTFNFNGEQLTQREIASHLDFLCHGCPSYADPKDKVKTPESEVFQKLFEEVQASGLPASKLDQVHTLVTNIGHVAVISGISAHQQSGDTLPKGVNGNIDAIAGKPVEYVSFDTKQKTDAESLLNLWMAQGVAFHWSRGMDTRCMVCKPYDAQQTALVVP